MANNLIEMVKKKLEPTDQIRLSSSDRALLEQTCKGLEEIRNQRLSEAKALEDMKTILQNKKEIDPEELAKLKEALEGSGEMTRRLAQEAKDAAEKAQAATEDMKRVFGESSEGLKEVRELIKNSQEDAKASVKKGVQPLLVLSWLQFLATLGVMAILVLNILGIV